MRSHEPKIPPATPKALPRHKSVPKSLLLRLQRLAGNKAVNAALSTVVPTGPGNPLDPAVRAKMEGTLGEDFGSVRVHTDGAADRSARAVGSQAYTVGSNIVFSRDRYSPGTQEGQELLAHELTHVRQQRQGQVSGTDRGDGVLVSDPSDAFEQEASRTASSLATSGPMLPPRAAGTAAASAPVIQAAPKITAVAAPADLGVGKSATVTATRAGPGAITWTLTGAPAGVTVTPTGGLTAKIVANAASLAGAGAAFTVKAGLTATPADNAVSKAVNLVGVTGIAFAPVPAFPAIGPALGLTGPAGTGEPNRDGVTGNTVTVTATTAPAGRAVTVSLPSPADHAVAATTITPGAKTGSLKVVVKENLTSTAADKSFFINPVATAVKSLGPTGAGGPYGGSSMVNFRASDTASALTRGVGETIVAGGRDDFGLTPVINGTGPNPNPILKSTVTAAGWNDNITMGTGAPPVIKSVDANKFVGPGVPTSLPAVWLLRQGFHWLSWTGAPNFSAEFADGVHRRSLIQTAPGKFFVTTEQVFSVGTTLVKKDAYAGNPFIQFTAVNVVPLAPLAAGGLAADGVATANATMVSTVAGRTVDWSLVSGSIAFTGAAAALPLATPVTITTGTVAGNAKLKGADTVFPNRQFIGVFPLRPVALSALAGPSSVPTGTLAQAYTFNAQPGGRIVNPTVDPAAAAAGVTAVAPPVGAAAAQTVTVTRPPAFIGTVTITVADSVLKAKTSSRKIKFR